MIVFCFYLSFLFIFFFFGLFKSTFLYCCFPKNGIAAITGLILQTDSKGTAYMYKIKEMSNCLGIAVLRNMHPQAVGFQRRVEPLQWIFLSSSKKPFPLIPFIGGFREGNSLYPCDNIAQAAHQDINKTIRCWRKETVFYPYTANSISCEEIGRWSSHITPWGKWKFLRNSRFEHT